MHLVQILHSLWYLNKLVFNKLLGFLNNKTHQKRLLFLMFALLELSWQKKKFKEIVG